MEGAWGTRLEGPAPSIHSHLHHPATIRCEKGGLVSSLAYAVLDVTAISYGDGGVGSQWGFSLASGF